MPAIPGGAPWTRSDAGAALAATDKMAEAARAANANRCMLYAFLFVASVMLMRNVFFKRLKAAENTNVILLNFPTIEDLEYCRADLAFVGLANAAAPFVQSGSMRAEWEEK
jgi:hypothetical protein